MKVMKNHIKTLIQIGVVYLVVSILIDSFLAGYPILTWAGLGLAFILFAIMIFGVLLELIPRHAAKKSVPQFRKNDDDLMRLDKLCRRAIDHGDARSTQLLFERVRSLAFAAAAYYLNIDEPQLRNMAEQNPTSLEQRIHDQPMFEMLTATSSAMSGRNSDDLRNYLTKIEDWSR
ncbi:MAG TPA: hypothetical protein VEG61_08880 [Candidatus Dormibacteraeota bacterium]|nr:hypothetical protein [Candidatus Dormibacteraeota bacterium]